MNGAQSLVDSFVELGVDTCFANPGTSEMHLVQAIDSNESMRAVLALFEGVCTGAADGYARIAGKPATTLLHLGAGLGNGIANLHNCRRAATPLINVIGDHARHHVAYDAPLTSDVESVAKPVSSWIRTSRSSEGTALDARSAYVAAMSQHPDPLGNISTLIVPADCAWGPGNIPGSAPEPTATRAKVDPSLITTVARKVDANTILMIDGVGLNEHGCQAASAIANTTGCQLFTPTFPPVVRGAKNLRSFQRLPYFPEQILELLGKTKRLVLAGCSAPVSFFAYEKLPSYLVPESCELLHLAHRHEDVSAALIDIAQEIGAASPSVDARPRPDRPSGALSIRSISQAIAAQIPDDSILVADSGGGAAVYPALSNCVDHTWMNLTGGSIGMGGPAAVGAAIAAPDTPVFALLGDGGAMYTNQYLWTAAREKLPLTSVIFANRQYNILEVEYKRLGINEIGEKAASMFDLGNPELNWVSLANAQGVPGERVQTADEFVIALDRAIQSRGPFLIEAVV